MLREREKNNRVILVEEHGRADQTVPAKAGMPSNPRGLEDMMMPWNTGRDGLEGYEYAGAPPTATHSNPLHCSPGNDSRLQPWNDAEPAPRCCMRRCLSPLAMTMTEGGREQKKASTAKPAGGGEREKAVPAFIVLQPMAAPPSHRFPLLHPYRKHSATSYGMGHFDCGERVKVEEKKSGRAISSKRERHSRMMPGREGERDLGGRWGAICSQRGDVTVALARYLHGSTSLNVFFLQCPWSLTHWTRPSVSRIVSAACLSGPG